MDTATFLRRVLPSQGVYFLAIPIASGGYKHKAFDTPEELAEAALYISSKGINAFYALAGYDKPVYIGEDGKQHWRTFENGVSARCFWMDIDIKTQYANKKEGAKDLYRFCEQTKLPSPNFIVDSGNGLHVYWMMDRDVPRDPWKGVADTLKGLAKKLNFAQDDVTRTADFSSVLRPIGCVNDKTAKGLGVTPVRLITSNLEPVDFHAFVRSVVDAKAEFGVSTREAKPKENINNDLGGDEIYPEASAAIIAQHCGQLKFMRDYKGAGQSEGAWRACLGILKHCVDGDDLVHEWSNGHEGYTHSATQLKLDNWKAGPSLCETFKDTNPTQCAGCVHKCKTPMQLGQVAPEIIHQVEHVDETEPTGVKIEKLPPMPARITSRFRFDTERGLTAQVKDEEGVTTWQTICTSMIVATGFFRDSEDGDSYKMRLQVRTKPNVWIESVIDAKIIGQGGSILMGELASKSMVSVTSPAHEKLMGLYMKTWMEEMKSENDEISMYTHMGWQQDESFVVGDTCFRPDGSIGEVILTDVLRKTVDKLGFVPAGDKERYYDLINTAYNRPGHEAYQFTYLAGFASPLIALMESSPIGIVYSAWSADSGFGKTSCAKLAAGIWHDPTKVVDAGGTTAYALTLNAGLRRNLPMVLDELTQWGKEKSGEFMYRYSSGMAKEQGAAIGGLRDNAHLNWSNGLITTGNCSQHENIKLYSTVCGPQLARVFEYEFTTPHNATMGAAEGRNVIDELMQMRGLAGYEFAAYIATHRAETRALLQETFSKLMDKAGLSKDARYWVIGASCVWVAYLITRQLKLHAFEQAPLIKWIFSQLKQHDSSVKESEVDYLLEFANAIGTLHRGFIVTLDRGARGIPAKMMPGNVMPNGDITGRVIENEGMLYLSTSALSAWCKESNIDKSQMIKALKGAGWYLGGKSVRIASGTTLPQPVVYCYEFDAHKFTGVLKIVKPVDQPEGVAA